MLEKINQIVSQIGMKRPIVKLEQKVANQIAAGEVIERPSAIVKELLENAIDASASKIEVSISDGGKSLVQVKDNGWGMQKWELPLAISRHATSKLVDNELTKVDTYGFRGEALPSIGASSRLKILSKTGVDDDSWEISVNNNVIGKTKPASINPGTIVEVRDLFFATPARLKFLKPDRIETQAIVDIFKRIALANPEINFSLADLSNPEKSKLIAEYTFFAEKAQPTGSNEDSLRKAYSQRIKQVFGSEIYDNLLGIFFSNTKVKIEGYISLPTYSRSNSSHQYFFVNGRAVWDKQLLSALRASYSDFIMRGRYPVSIIYITCPPDSVDANVHPAKTEVRFQDFKFLRSTLISTIRQSIASANNRTSTVVSENMMNAFSANVEAQKLRYGYSNKGSVAGYSSTKSLSNEDKNHNDKTVFFSDVSSRMFETGAIGNLEESGGNEEENLNDQDFPLGSPVAHVHQNYIISQTEKGLVITDQHAAHERIVYEELKDLWSRASVNSQALLLPEVVELGNERTSILIEFKKELDRLGMVIEPFGSKSICLRSLPAILGQVNGNIIINDLADELLEQRDISVLEEKIEGVISRIACHGSVRSGRKLNVQEMDALLRKMELTPFSNQCNHGRPTFVELKLTEIEKLFERN